MKKKGIYQIAALLLIALIVAGAPQFAQAANTAAGTTITNTATVNYTVGGVPQTAVIGSTNFVVDRVINFVVTKTSDVTSAPSATFQALQFIVSNTSNTTMRFALQPVSKGTNTWDFGASVKIYRDNNNDAKYDGADTLYGSAATFGDIASGGTLTVLIVGDMPAGLTNGLTSVYDLLATAVDSGGTTTSVATVGANTVGVDTVFADSAGSAAADGARDGKHSASGTITVTAAGMSVVKSSVVYWDPTNLFVNPKAIPGAIIEYTVKITNSGGAIASNVSIVDNLNTMIATNGYISFNTQFINTQLAPATSCAAGQGSAISTNSGTTWTCQNGTWNAGTNTLTVSGLTINAGGSAWIRYQVTIQ